MKNTYARRSSPTLSFFSIVRLMFSRRLFAAMLALFLLAHLRADAQVVDTAAVRQEVDSLMLANQSLCAQVKYQEAIANMVLSKEKAEKYFGIESTIYAKCQFNHAKIFHLMKKYKDAELLYIEALNTIKKVVGKNHALYASTLANLGHAYMAMGIYDSAESSLLEAQYIHENNIKEFDQEYAIILNNLALLYNEIGKFEQADPYYAAIIEIQDKINGRTSHNYASALNNWAVSYADRGEYDKAEPLYIKSIEILKNIPDRELQYARYLGNLSNVYFNKGDYDKAEQIELKILEIRRERRDRRPMEFILGLKKIADFYRLLNQRKKAESLYLETINLIEKHSGKENSNYVNTLNGLGHLYLDMEEYNKTEPLFLEAVMLRKILSGRESLHYATSLDNLALLYLAMKSLEKVEALFLESIDIQEKISGIDQQYYSSTLRNLSLLYKEMGDVRKAEDYLIKAKINQESVLGEKHPDYAKTLNQLAAIYFTEGRYPESEKLFLKTLSIWENSLGKNHKNYATTLHNIGRLYGKMREYAKAESHFMESSIAIKTNLRKSATYLTSEELEQLTVSFQRQNNAFLSFISMHPSDSIRRLAFNNSLFYKGFGLETAITIERAIREASDSIKSIYSRWKGYNLLMAKELSHPASDRKHYARLDSASNALEKILIRATSPFANARRQVEWSDVQNALQSNEVAIEFVHYFNVDGKIEDSTIYAALLLLPGSCSPKFIPLFEERELQALLPTDKSIENLSKSSLRASYIKNIYTNPALYALLWAPIENALAEKGINTVYFSPSGILHRLNLGAIADNSRAPLADGYRMVQLGSTRELVIDRRAVQPKPLSAMIYGGVRYEMDSTAIAIVNRGLGAAAQDTTGGLFRYSPHNNPSGGTRGDDFKYLGGSEREARHLHELLKRQGISSTLRTGYSATEESFKKIGQDGPSPGLLHIGTHGFFFPDPKDTTRRRDVARIGDDAPAFKISEHPLIRSGLLLAGSKYAWEQKRPMHGMEDGILTAHEVSQMDLSNTELVVLSACETGLGDIKGSEGVYGLQRAFRIAGAKNVLMSLWQVSDEATALLLNLFYENWLQKGLAVRAALEDAQSWMRGKEEYRNPYFWAGFVLVGE